MIYKAVSLFFVLLSMVLVVGQNAAVELSKMNVFYIGVDNPIKIAVENFSCEEINVSISQGAIRKGEDCDYTANVESVGQCSIEIIAGGDTIKKWFRVKHVPLPKLTLGGDITLTGDGVVQKGTIIAKGGIVPLLIDFEVEARFVVKSYSLVFFNDTSFYFYNGEGPMFPDGLFHNLDHEGVLLFDNFILSGPGRKNFSINEKMFFDVGYKKVDLDIFSPTNYVLSNSANFDSVSISNVKNEISYHRYKIDSNSVLVEKFQGSELLFQHEIIYSDKLIHHKYLSPDKVILKQYDLNVEVKDFYYYYQNVEFPDTFYVNKALKVGSYIESHPNGQTKIKGFYVIVDDMKLDTFKHTEYVYSLPITSTVYKTVSKKSVKDGLWTYYNEKGKAIRKEWYEEGVLVKEKD